ncbi:RHS repeat domain-containing protein [Facilibium subflavum]|uniref:RHS repeat domain-containing protein n=1 Tax=Facilibium subflavum TaxID=2219058 RepID=UPI000E655BF3|nr:RHS repeat-associated core domain-containing protein [Facilibium subflavum]
MKYSRHWMLLLLLINGCYAFKYDANGNMLADNNGRTYRYNAQDQLISFTDKRQHTTHYHYNSNNLLDNEIAKNKTQNFIYASLERQHYMLENSITDTQGSVSFINKNVLCINSQMSHCFYKVADQKNAMGVWLDKDQHVMQVKTFSPFGNIWRFGYKQEKNNIFNVLDYDGEYRDSATGLIYLHARFYSPGLMRFMQRDSYHFMNRYSFTDDNPINKTDPSGHFSLTSGLSLSALGVGILAPVLSSSTLYFMGAMLNIAATSIPLLHANVSRIIGDSVAMLGSFLGTAALMSGNSKAIFATEFSEHWLQGIAMPFISNKNNKITFKKAGISAVASLPYAIYMATSAALLTGTAEEDSWFPESFYQDAILESHDIGTNNARLSDYLRSFSAGALRMGVSELVRLSYFPISKKLGASEEYPNTSIWQNVGMAAMAGGFQYAGMAATRVRMQKGNAQIFGQDLNHTLYNTFNYGWGEQFTVAQLELG